MCLSNVKGEFFMNKAKQLLDTVLVKEMYKYMEKDPMKNLTKMVDWAEKVMTQKSYYKTAEMFREIAKDPENNWNILIQRYFKELNKNTQQKFLVNFIVNAGIVGNSIIEKSREKYNCNVPWAILFDPTAACNLKCTGCWAAEYGKSTSLDFSVMEKIISEGKALGTYMYILSGGEPLMRKDEIIRLCEEHSDCMFLSFTNATLVDEQFAAEVERVGNLAFAISVEGFEEETDMRRGKGTYQKVMEAMDILHRHGVIFGFSTCYHSRNVDIVGSEEWVDFMVEKGCTFGWYFTYIPVGKDAVMDLLASPEQREFMLRRVREYRVTKPIFIMDFWNDGEYVKGCVAGGRNYLHINANGDVEPCAFIHYSNVNIKNAGLVEALQSPLFKQYKLNQPFCENHLRPCPLLDNPEKLRAMVEKSGAHSTQMVDNESVEELTDKCIKVSEDWKIAADRLWNSETCKSHTED
jgi:MoaA/NifB/PqqE/SkfB family radical SAM enzyme